MSITARFAKYVPVALPLLAIVASCNDSRNSSIEYSGYIIQVKTFGLFSKNTSFEDSYPIDPGVSSYANIASKLNKAGSQGKCGTKLFKVKFIGRTFNKQNIRIEKVLMINEVKKEISRNLIRSSKRISLSNIEPC
jgi:hypothetical protein